MKKLCTKCNREKSATEFYKKRASSDGLQFCCKKCAAALLKKWGKTEAGKEFRKTQKEIKKRWRETECGKKYMKKYQKEYRAMKQHKDRRNEQMREHYKDPKNRLKIWCRGVLNNAVACKKIKKRNTCEICYDFPTECHHDDYNKPLEFIELCVGCHKYLHKTS